MSYPKKNKLSTLLVFTIIVFLLLLITLIRPPLLPILSSTYVGYILTIEETRNILIGFQIGIVSAIVFHYFSVVVPKKQIDDNSKLVLNRLIASVLDSYNRTRIFGHETSIKHVNTDTLKFSWLKNEKLNLKKGEVEYLKLKYAMETAHSKLNDFRQSLCLAVNISPEHSIGWLDITEKIKLLSESYESIPIIPDDKIFFINYDDDRNPIKDFRSTLILRFLEILESTEEWLKLK